MKNYLKPLFLLLVLCVALSAQVQDNLIYQGSNPANNAPGGCLIQTNPTYNYTTGVYWYCVPNTTPPLNLGTWTSLTYPTTVLAGNGAGQQQNATAAQVNALATAAAGVAAGAVGSAALTSNTTVGNTAIQVCHATYSFAVDGGGAPGLITPASNCTIPANSVIYNEIINWTTAGTGATNTTTIGTTGTGGGAAILQASTAVASLTGIVQGVIVPQTASGFKKITTAGAVTLTTATAALTAGVCEIYVFYITSST